MENVVNPLHAQAAGLDYYGIGSTPVRPRKPFVLEAIHSYERRMLMVRL
jgi:hypothetical protein